MAVTTTDELREWIKTAAEKGAAYLLIVCDTFSWEDYPVYISPDEDLLEVIHKYDGVDMQMVMDLYQLGRSMACA
jgi:hypothetical protein